MQLVGDVNEASSARGQGRGWGRESEAEAEAENFFVAEATMHGADRGQIL